MPRLRRVSSLAVVLACLTTACGARSGLTEGEVEAEPARPRGPWPMRGQGPQNRARGVAPAIASPVERWSFPVTDADGAVSFASPAIAVDGSIYLQRGNAGSVLALSADGALKWEAAGIATDGGSSESSPAIGANGSIYVGAGAQLVALDPDGKVVWSVPTASTVRGSPVVAEDGTITFGDDTGHLYAADAGGSLLWSVALPSTVSLLEWTPAVAPDGTVYAAVGKSLYAFVNGDVAWTADLAAAPSDASWDAPRTPSIADDGTIVVPLPHEVRAFHPDGSPKWTFSPDSALDATISTPAALAADGTAYVAMNVEVPFSGAVVAIGPDGTRRWSATTSFSAGPMSPTVTSTGDVYTTDPIQIVHPDGAVAMTGIPDAQAITPIVIDADGGFYLVFDGALHAFGP